MKPEFNLQDVKITTWDGNEIKIPNEVKFGLADKIIGETIKLPEKFPSITITFKSRKLFFMLFPHLGHAKWRDHLKKRFFRD